MGAQPCSPWQIKPRAKAAQRARDHGVARAGDVDHPGRLGRNADPRAALPCQRPFSAHGEHDARRPAPPERPGHGLGLAILKPQNRGCLVAVEEKAAEAAQILRQAAGLGRGDDVDGQGQARSACMGNEFGERLGAGVAIGEEPIRAASSLHRIRDQRAVKPVEDGHVGGGQMKRAARLEDGDVFGCRGAAHGPDPGHIDAEPRQMAEQGAAGRVIAHAGEKADLAAQPGEVLGDIARHAAEAD